MAHLCALVLIWRNRSRRCSAGRRGSSLKMDELELQRASAARESRTPLESSQSYVYPQCCLCKGQPPHHPCRLCRVRGGMKRTWRSGKRPRAREKQGLAAPRSADPPAACCVCETDATGTRSAASRLVSSTVACARQPTSHHSTAPHSCSPMRIALTLALLGCWARRGGLGADKRHR